MWFNGTNHNKEKENRPEFCFQHVLTIMHIVRKADGISLGPTDNFIDSAREVFVVLLFFLEAGGCCLIG